MLIAEIFHSIQGEGSLAGVPSVFIRVAGCNLRCAWCDTPYASWQPEGVEMGVEEIVREAGRFAARHVVLTGGEPMVARGIHGLAAALKARGFHITIETAGALPPGGIACDLASVSPKLSNSTPAAGSASPEWIARHERGRLRFDALRAWVDGYDFQLKFVVRGLEDLPELEDVLRRIGRPVEAWRVLLMPEGTEPESLRARRKDLVALCLERGFRYCDRLHIHLFGNTRGT